MYNEQCIIDNGKKLLTVVYGLWTKKQFAIFQFVIFNFHGSSN